MSIYKLTTPYCRNHGWYNYPNQPSPPRSKFSLSLSGKIQDSNSIQRVRQKWNLKCSPDDVIP